MKVCHLIGGWLFTSMSYFQTRVNFKENWSNIDTLIIHELTFKILLIKIIVIIFTEIFFTKLIHYDIITTMNENYIQFLQVAVI